MLQNSIEPINAEDLPVDEYRFVKAQQNIYELCQNLEQEQTLKSSLENAKNTEEFRQIAGEYGYEFTISDLQFALHWAGQKTDPNFDELDDYELDEEELEAVAGGARAATKNSYWHQTGILVNQQCFHLVDQSTEARAQIETALQTMELWVWEGNNTVSLIDLDGQYSPYKLTGIAYDGLALSLLQNTSDRNKWSNYSSGNITNLLL
ncbi:Nif11-like leader peptide family natural product precursor [Phormidium sp. LEGE 05292]|uniref:Nif11-like leader peptide family natural product precursor n=1 Tax=[Phormidium] sp. LEGE 05292 TaxID=767427 RepID=UPI00188104E2|nr:Nif11-like leader peptide family natural product precursor [Phormidium sp. LEGE 05292]MBE9224928.1 Nif11-like leader peptide family natural product precursor [Phormidium sp. LEGE 05292]